MQLVEALFGEALSGLGEQEVAVGDAHALLPAGAEDGGVYGGHAGDVGVGFGGDVEAAGAGSFDHGEAFEGVAEAGAVDVDDVEGGSGDGGGSDDFGDGFDGGAGFDAAGAADVGVDGQAAFGGEMEDVEDFRAGGAGGVLNAHADGEASGIEFCAEALEDGCDLFGCGVLIGCGAGFGQDGSGGQRGAEDERAGGDVACGGAVVDERAALFCF